MIKNYGLSFYRTRNFSLKNAIPRLIVVIKNYKIVIDRKSVFSKDQESKDYVNPLRNILFAKLKSILIDSKILTENSE